MRPRAPVVSAARRRPAERPARCARRAPPPRHCCSRSAPCSRRAQPEQGDAAACAAPAAASASAAPTSTSRLTCPQYSPVSGLRAVGGAKKRYKRSRVTSRERRSSLMQPPGIASIGFWPLTRRPLVRRLTSRLAGLLTSGPIRMRCWRRRRRRANANLRLLQTIPSAFAALRANKGRSILTTLGIIIGVAAVIAIVALGEGASASVANQLAGLGTNLLTVQPGSTQSGGARTGAGNAITLKAADADAISQDIPGLSGVSPVVSGNAQIIAGSQNWSTRVQAVTPPYLTIENWTIAEGTAFTDAGQHQRGQRGRARRHGRPEPVPERAVAGRSGRSASATCRSRSSACWPPRAPRPAATRTTRSSSRSGRARCACSARTTSTRSSSRSPTPARWTPSRRR